MVIVSYSPSAIPLSKEICPMGIQVLDANSPLRRNLSGPSDVHYDVLEIDSIIEGNPLEPKNGTVPSPLKISISLEQ